MNGQGRPPGPASRSTTRNPSARAARGRDALRSLPLWLSAFGLIAISLLHYLTPQQRVLPLFFNTSLSRHAAERILFVLPVAGAAYAVGQLGGWAALGMAVLVMLPRAIWLSPHPADALVETAVGAFVGALLVWMIEVQKRARSERQDAVSRLQAISSVTAILSRSLELEQVLDQTLDAILAQTGLQAGIVYVVDPETGNLAPAAHRGVEAPPAGEYGARDGYDALRERLASEREAFLVTDPERSQWLEPLTSSLPAGGPQVVVPLKAEGTLQGAMVLGSRRPRPVASEELELTTAIGNQTGVAIQNAQLHRRAERQLRVQQQLNQVAEQITSELDPDRVLPKVLQIAQDLTGADGGLIALFDPESELMHYPYLHNLPIELARVAVPPDKGLAAEVMTTRRPLVIDDYPSYDRAIAEFVQAGVSRIAGVPVASGGRAFGTLAVVGLGGDGRFSESDVALLEGIGRQAGIAIQNARLYARMRFYAREIVRAQENERRRIARDLHDETIQMLIVLLRRVEVLQTLPDRLPEAATQHLEALQDLIGSTLRGVRRFVQDLRPPTLDHLGLVATLEALVDDVEQVDGLSASLRITGDVRRLAPEQGLALFRIAQEALSNVRRHAGASVVTLSLDFQPETVRLVVEDDGQGFNAPARMDDLVSAGRLGLIGMNERARNLGGTLTIQSELGQGTSVIVSVGYETNGA